MAYDIISIYNWVVFHPLCTANKGFGHCSIGPNICVFYSSSISTKSHNFHLPKFGFSMNFSNASGKTEGGGTVTYI